MDYLYSLYDALVSISAPHDKARAVVDAMERDMGTTIATKTDLQLLEQKLAGRFDGQFVDLRHHVNLEIGRVRHDLELLSTRLQLRLGSMLVVGFAAMTAALKLLLG